MQQALSSEFREGIRRLTQPLNGQYPRPWMTSLEDPQLANVFIVGMNQATGFPSSQLSHERFMDALFNDAGHSCRALYDSVRGDKGASPTRKNLDRLCSFLQVEGAGRVLETNVICYSTPMSGDLILGEHKGGSERGTEIFRFLLRFIRPRVLVVHGAGTRTKLMRLLGSMLPDPPRSPHDPAAVVIDGMTVIVLPSLAPPAWNKWSVWADDHLAKVAKKVAALAATTNQPEPGADRASQPSGATS